MLNVCGNGYKGGEMVNFRDYLQGQERTLNFIFDSVTKQLEKEEEVKQNGTAVGEKQGQPKSE